MTIVDVLGGWSMVVNVVMAIVDDLGSGGQQQWWRW